MEATISQRVSRIIEAHRRSADAVEFERAVDRDRRLARENVLRELPKLDGLVSRTIAELNDTLSEGSIRLILEITGHQPTAEATYALKIANAASDAPSLSLSVDWTGAARAMLHEGPRRSLLATYTVFEVDKARISDLGLKLLEAYYL